MLQPHPQSNPTHGILVGLCLLVASLMAGCFVQTEPREIPVSQVQTPEPVSSEGDPLDFALAFQEVRFSDSADDNGSSGQNGIPDSFEMALIEAILRDPSIDLSAKGGVKGTQVFDAWQQAYASARTDISQHLEQWPNVGTVVAGYVMVGTDNSFQAIQRMTTSFGSPLTGDYTLAKSLGPFLGPDGDADGDGASNRSEYLAFGQEDRAKYVQAALDPSLIPTEEQQAQASTPKRTRFVVGVVLYEGFEVLDVYGPVEMWGNVPEFELVTIAEIVGAVRSAQGLETVARFTFEDAPKIDILLVPGGFGTMKELKNETFLSFLKKRHSETVLTTSVCTGSALLAKAGLLDGLRATSNKAFFTLATNQSDQVTWVEQARWVEDGKVFTSSGVSAGTDMALAVVQRLFGESRAVRLAEQLEYQWHREADRDPFVRLLQKP